MGSLVREKQRYRKKDAFHYTREKILGLPPLGKLLVDYILVAQVNRCGIFLFSPGRAREELGLSQKVFDVHFELVLTTLGWKFDRGARVLYVPTWWRYNAPANQKNMLGNLEDLKGLPNTPLLNEFAANVRYLSPTIADTLTQGMGAGIAYRMASQESGSSETGNRETGNRETPPSPPAGGRSAGRAPGGKVSESKSEESVPCEVLIRMWNDLPCVNQFKGEPGKATRRRIKKLWLEHPELSWWTDYYGRIAGTPELKGYLDSGWCASLTWALEQKNIEKVLGGHYGDPHPIEQEA